MIKKMKTAAFLLAILLSMLFVSTGCTDIVPEGTSDRSKDSGISIGTATESSATNDENTIGTTELTNDADAEQWESRAKSLYDAACDMYFGIIFNGGYFQENENTSSTLNMSFHEVSDERATTVADVKAELRTVFSESYASQYDSQVDEKYKEVDGKLYQQQSGKGGNVTLKDVDIKFISADDNKASFHAIAHYIDGSDITEPFTLIYENGDWKVSEFSDPNLFAEMYVTGSSTEKEQWESKAKSLYDAACDMYFGIIFNGGYFQENENTSSTFNMSFHEVSDERATTVADVKAELRTVFSESYASQYDSQVDEKYKEVDGKLYQQQSGKGGNVTLKDVDIKFISADDNKASFYATAHYIIDGSDITEPFTLVYENGDWKVSEFSDPNLFAKMYVTDSDSEVPASTDSSEKEQWETKARQLYSNAKDVFFGVIINGSYFETNGNTIKEDQGTILNEVSDSRASTVADVKAEVRKIFSESYAVQYDSQIDFVYKEVDGKLYQIQQNKGGLFSMEDMEIELISADDQKATFNVVVHVPGGADVYGVDPFTLVYEDGSWKVSEYTHY